MSKPCSVIEHDLQCDGPAHARKMCRLHYKRWNKWGDPLAAFPVGGQPGPRPGGRGKWRTDDVGCVGAHSRVRSLWGKATAYACVSCDADAQEWAYDGTDPTQKYGPSTSRREREYWTYYSACPEFYMPMCKRCHRIRDGNVAKSQLDSLRTLMHETGFSLGQIIELVKAA